MLNKVNDGKTIEVTMTEDIAAGGVMVINGKPGIAIADIPSAGKGILDMEGGVYRFTLANALAADKAQGAPVYLPSGATVSEDGSDLTLTSAAGVTEIGCLNKPAPSGAKEIDVRLI